MRTQAQIRKEIQKSVKAAEKLTEVGMNVIVTDDFGKEHKTQLTVLPWQLGHGSMVANCTGFTCYDCSRIRPA